MKRIAALNDLSGFGKCSLAVALPIISACGVECTPMPTSILTRQTAFESSVCFDMTENMNSFLKDWENEKFDGIYTGFFSDSNQIKVAFDFISGHSEASSVLVDPILGDDGETYSIFSNEIFEGVKALTKTATVITPNLTELGLLTDTDYNSLLSYSYDEIYKLALSLMENKTKYVLITGIHKNQKICNLVCDKNGYRLVSSKYHHGSFSGTGDIFASVCAAEIVKGKSVLSAVKTAVKIINKSINTTIKSGTDSRYGVQFEKYLKLL